jgi:drug/metabolite transporter (DMT)-like permease
MNLPTDPRQSPDHPGDHATAKPRAPRPWAIWAALITVYVVWGSTYLGIRFAIESLPPFTMGGVRFVFAGAALYAWRRARGDVAPSVREWRSAAIVGLLLLAGGSGSVVWAEQRIASGVAALLVAMVPLWMVLIDMVRPGGHRPGWRAGLGVLTGFAGVALLIRPTQAAGSAGSVDLVGAAAVMLGSLLWSIGSLYNRTAQLPASPLLATSMEMLAGGAGLLLLGTLTGEWARLDVGGISARSLLALAYLVAVGAWVGYSAYTWLLRVAPTPLVSTYAYVNPLIAIVLGHVLAGEPFTARVLLAAAVIVGSVALITAVQPGSRGTKATCPKFVPTEES